MIKCWNNQLTGIIEHRILDGIQHPMVTRTVHREDYPIKFLLLRLSYLPLYYFEPIK